MKNKHIKYVRSEKYFNHEESGPSDLYCSNEKLDNSINFISKSKHELPPLKKRKDKYSKMKLRVDNFLKTYF